MRLVLIILFCSLTIGTGYADTIPKYKRSFFGGWSDTDGDCQNTRHELLQKLSTSSLTFTPNTCRVLRGRWLDPYTDRIFRDSSEVDIDHLVPLFYAWQRGAYLWSTNKRRRFANDERNLFAVQRSVNREKSAMGPTEWLPPNVKFRCSYITRFERVMRIYELQFFAREKIGIRNLKDQYCR